MPRSLPVQICIRRKICQDNFSMSAIALAVGLVSTESAKEVIRG